MHQLQFIIHLNEIDSSTSPILKKYIMVNWFIYRHAKLCMIILFLEVMESHKLSINIYIFYCWCILSVFFVVVGTRFYDINYSYLTQLIWTQLYGFKNICLIRIITWVYLGISI